MVPKSLVMLIEPETVPLVFTVPGLTVNVRVAVVICAAVPAV